MTNMALIPMTEQLDPIPLSAINHFAYCPRRCALIHMEGEFVDNIHTMRGRSEHEQVDRVAYETRRSGARVEYALPVWSDRLGLIGKCDALEFWPDGSIYPVEYKHGARKKWRNDDLQLAAQAMCLEEMLGRHLTQGAIYHASSHRRREVAITPALRQAVEQTTAAIRAMLQGGQLPPPANDARCRECSLIEICEPAAIADRATQGMLRAELFNPADMP
jgi:CRISPR-associated exonuclease Cas4